MRRNGAGLGDRRIYVLLVAAFAACELSGSFRFENGSICAKRSPSIGSLQHFVSLFSAVRNLFVPSRINRSASRIRNHRLPHARPGA